MDMDAIGATIKTKLGIDIASDEAVVQGLMAELIEIAHKAETSTVPSDLAVLRAQALPIIGQLTQLAHRGEASATDLKGEVDKLGAGFSAVKESVDRLWSAHGELVDKVANPPQPPQQAFQPPMPSPPQGENNAA